MTQEKSRLGIDFGGTKTEIIGLDASNGKELYRKRIPTVPDDYKANLENFKNLVIEAERTLGMTGTVGMGIPGSISMDDGCVKNSNAVYMNGQPLQTDINELLDREVRIQNDANCFAVSEAVDGAARGAKIVFGVIIGTGCGGGVAIDAKAVTGINGVAGEWGHNPLPKPRMYVPEIPADPFANDTPHEDTHHYPFLTMDESWNEYPGPVCYCGHRNCQELWMSGTGFKRDYQHVTGEDLSTHDVIVNVKQGESKAVAAFERYVDRLARGLGVVINLIDPDVIVLGGGMSNVAMIYDELPKVWGKYITSDVVHTQLKPALHGDSSGVRGAAWLWNNE